MRENLASNVTVFVATGKVASVKSFCSLVLLHMWYHLEKILAYFCPRSKAVCIISCQYSLRLNIFEVIANENIKLAWRI